MVANSIPSLDGARRHKVSTILLLLNIPSNPSTLSRYGYTKNHKKTVKSEQARTRERKSEQKPEAKPGKSSLSQIQSNYGQ
ncbi:hypothetical protein Tco_0972126 [Tanacetum coccineum]